MTTPHLMLPLLEAGQAQKHLTVNDALLALDAWAEGKDARLAAHANGAATSMRILGLDTSPASGTVFETALVIPGRALVFGVTARVTAALTGIASFAIGVDGNAGQFGSGLGTAAGSTNTGIIGPTAFYAPTPLRLTATGGSFAGGSVRLALHILELALPA
jgi:hypothetical protein